MLISKKGLKFFVSMALITGVILSFGGGFSVFADKVLDLDMSAPDAWGAYDAWNNHFTILPDLSGNGNTAEVKSKKVGASNGGVYREPINSSLTYPSVFMRRFLWENGGAASSNTRAMIGTETGGSALAPLMAGAVTIETWVKLPASSGQNLLTINGSGLKLYFPIPSNGTTPYKVYFERAYTTKNGRWCTSSTIVPIDTWTHVAISYDPSLIGNRPYIYINGVATGVGVADSMVAAGTIVPLTAPVIVGNHYTVGDTAWQWNRPFKGSVGSMTVYNSSLSADEILDHYNADKANYGFIADTKVVYDSSNTLLTSANLTKAPLNSRVEINLALDGSRVVDTTSLTAANIKLVNKTTNSEVPYAADTAYDIATKTFKVTPPAALDVNTVYELTAANITDTLGGAVIVNSPISFTTVADPYKATIASDKTSVTVAVDGVNQLVTDEAILGLALYEKTGESYKLSNISLDQYTLENAKTTISCTLTGLPADIVTATSKYMVKAFLWDGFTSLKPTYNAKIITIN